MRQHIATPRNKANDYLLRISHEVIANANMLCNMLAVDRLRKNRIIAFLILDGVELMRRGGCIYQLYRTIFTA
jgi:hypothetical protein